MTFSQKNLQQCLAFDEIPALKPETIAKGARTVENAGAGLDYKVIREHFAQQLTRGFAPDSVDGAFINFVKKKVTA